VSACLVLVAGILVDVRRRQNGVTLDLGRERNRAEYCCTRALSRLDDLAGRAIDQTMIVCLQPNPNLLVRNNRVLFSKERNVKRSGFSPHRTTFLSPYRGDTLIAPPKFTQTKRALNGSPG
jgi:hypothetical protein